jgi:Secretion system C-terminal sorting domain
VKAQYPNLDNDATVAVPQVFVKKGSYDNGFLTLTISNTLGAKSLTINGNSTQSETKDRTPFSKKVTLTGAAEETIEVAVGSVFDMGFTVRNEKSTDFDALYFADGAWGLEYNKATNKVDKFDISATNAKVETGVFTVERNPSLKGTAKDYISLFRSIRPAGEAANMTKYQNLSFKGVGQGLVEVTLVKKSITDWSKQYRKEVSLFGEKTPFNIALDEFKNGDAKGATIVADDITHVVFTMKGDGKTDKVIEIALEDVVFTTKKAAITTIAEGTLTAFPNPAFGRTDLNFNLAERTKGVVTIANTQGQKVLETNQEFTKGNNRMPIDLTNFKPGFYIVSLTTASGKLTTKILIP